MKRNHKFNHIIDSLNEAKATSISHRLVMQDFYRNRDQMSAGDYAELNARLQKINLSGVPQTDIADFETFKKDFETFGKDKFPTSTPKAPGRKIPNPTKKTKSKAEPEKTSLSGLVGDTEDLVNNPSITPKARRRSGPTTVEPEVATQQAEPTVEPTVEPKASVEKPVKIPPATTKEVDATSIFDYKEPITLSSLMKSPKALATKAVAAGLIGAGAIGGGFLGSDLAQKGADYALDKTAEVLPEPLKPLVDNSVTRKAVDTAADWTGFAFGAGAGAETVRGLGNTISSFNFRTPVQGLLDAGKNLGVNPLKSGWSAAASKANLVTTAAVVGLETGHKIGEVSGLNDWSTKAYPRWKSEKPMDRLEAKHNLEMDFNSDTDKNPRVKRVMNKTEADTYQASEGEREKERQEYFKSHGQGLGLWTSTAKEMGWNVLGGAMNYIYNNSLPEFNKSLGDYDLEEIDKKYRNRATQAGTVAGNTELEKIKAEKKAGSYKFNEFSMNPVDSLQTNLFDNSKNYQPPVKSFGKESMQKIIDKTDTNKFKSVGRPLSY